MIVITDRTAPCPCCTDGRHGDRTCAACRGTRVIHQAAHTEEATA